MANNVPLQTWKIASYDPVGRCIYCGSTENLTNEHIIPFGLLAKGGDWHLPDASCEDCACITKKFEGNVQGEMLGPLRRKLGLKARNRGKGKRKKTVTTTFNYPDGSLRRRELSFDEFPLVCIGFNWRAPRLLRGLSPEGPLEGNDVIKANEADLAKYARSDQAIRVAKVFPDDFARMLAKIAHVYASAEFPSEFIPELPPIILGQDSRLSNFVGGDESGQPFVPADGHHIARQDCCTNGTHYALVVIHLFANLGMPRYHVVVGKKTDQNPPALLK